jgi:hypothetical protein
VNSTLSEISPAVAVALEATIEAGLEGVADVSVTVRAEGLDSSVSGERKRERHLQQLLFSYIVHVSIIFSFDSTPPPQGYMDWSEDERRAYFTGTVMEFIQGDSATTIFRAELQRVDNAYTENPYVFFSLHLNSLEPTPSPNTSQLGVVGDSTADMDTLNLWIIMVIAGAGIIIGLCGTVWFWRNQKKRNKGKPPVEMSQDSYEGTDEEQEREQYQYGDMRRDMDPYGDYGDENEYFVGGIVIWY